MKTLIIDITDDETYFFPEIVFDCEGIIEYPEAKRHAILLVNEPILIFLN